jgi:hypothetical protein
MKCPSSSSMSFSLSRLVRIFSSESYSEGHSPVLYRYRVPFFGVLQVPLSGTEPRKFLYTLYYAEFPVFGCQRAFTVRIKVVFGGNRDDSALYGAGHGRIKESVVTLKRYNTVAIMNAAANGHSLICSGRVMGPVQPRSTHPK